MLPSQGFALICYVLTYVRYVKDNSIMNVLLSVLIVVLSQVIQQMVTLYYSKCQGSNQGPNPELPTIFKVIVKGLRYYQAVFLLQFVNALLYHLRFDIEKDVCSWKHGYIFTDIIGEFDCGRGGKWPVFALDVCLLLSQLLAFNESFSVCGRALDDVERETSLEGFNSHDYGILSILRFDSVSTQAHELKFSNEGRILGANVDNSYGTIVARDV
ncbi:LANO_0H20076g1_1 [Lachancea nothofagi CBS 11611]|uniref:LANO_0H20076g1_1 n=1 Tax=Lachancea nothofagi CBS 11611 TaxID=1266666 RepID=A0A1G4KN74_9SACH|nr:LANO_0H20076g1_1 [Lachancea nothofagi CBS 11611]